MRGRGPATSLFAALLLVGATPALSAPCPDKPLDAQDFQRYFDCFNTRDYACFASFYSPDVILSKGPRWPDLHGREAIVAFYHDVDAHGLREHATAHRIVVGPGDAAVDLEAHFNATKDWPDFGSRAVKTGDDWRLRSVMFYRISCGKITDIRPADRTPTNAP